MDFYRTTIVRRFLNDAALMYVGNWMDMDEKSGATYQVHCKPV